MCSVDDCSYTVDVVIACMTLLQWMVDTVVMVGWLVKYGGGCGCIQHMPSVYTLHSRSGEL